MHIDDLANELLVGSVTIRGQQYTVRQPTFRDIQSATSTLADLPGPDKESKRDRNARWLSYRNAIQAALAIGLDLGDPVGAFDRTNGAAQCGAWGIAAADVVLDRMTDDEVDLIFAELVRLSKIDLAEAAAAKS